MPTKNKEMRLTVVPGMSLAEEEKLVREVYDNFPESSLCLTCLEWDYKGFKFRFVDSEEGEYYVVRLKDAIRGLRLFCAVVDSGGLKGLGLKAGYKFDTGMWDASAFDALNQMAIFGAVLLG